jgi:hypothetical protein
MSDEGPSFEVGCVADLPQPTIHSGAAWLKTLGGSKPKHAVGQRILGSTRLNLTSHVSWPAGHLVICFEPLERGR